MKIDDLIHTAEIEIPRRPSEFLKWVETIFEKINNANPNDDDEELETQIYMRTGIAKQLYEEIVPLELLLRVKKEPWSCVSVKNIIGNQQYDVEILKEGKDFPDIPDRLEITYAIDGRDYKLRMEHLIKHGLTSMTGPVVVDKSSSGKREVRIESEARLAGETVDVVSRLINTAIQNKLGKGYRIGTGLIIYAEDYGTFRSEKYLSLLCDVIDNSRKSLKETFHSVYLILSSNGKVVEW